ncbi:MBL fold metallo-hydrolase [Pleionea sp. CnH1-48]|uniref:MBL fold metallo-hydrolase n=1 Tax=Pleionea sp. CnH1-48 TaxID=2954494 RepID=UPI0020983C24|nr:MBL fold metallo-hydrolase [Pleionea sp. CnH1-48]MCO7223311.1 MBL fold metallo-hydrolase [Pleionea sp. CnH1-48]
MKSIISLFFLAILLTLSTLSATAKAPLTLKVFNPGEKSIFPVTSSLIIGQREVILVDAQFQRNDALTLVSMIKETGKTLTTIYISHGDPDYYFGLEVIKSAFPKARILSSPTTKAYIEKTAAPKLKYWGPILGKNAPTQTYIPEAIKGDTLTIDNQVVNVVGLDGHDPKHTFLWIPSLRTIVGGVSVFDNMHAWLADSQTPQSRQDWQKTLNQMNALHPKRVVPGHFLGKQNNNASAIGFIQTYLNKFEDSANKAKNSKELIQLMKQHYPNIKGDALLELSAKVIEGEQQWP